MTKQKQSFEVSGTENSVVVKIKYYIHANFFYCYQKYYSLQIHSFETNRQLGFQFFTSLKQQISL